MAIPKTRVDVDDGGAASTSAADEASLLWTCPICLDTLDEPMLTTCCGQSFCRGCLDGALALVDACPMCRAPLLSGTHSMTRNRALDSLLKRMRLTTNGSVDTDVLLTIHEDEDHNKDNGNNNTWTTLTTTAWRRRIRACLQRIVPVQRDSSLPSLSCSATALRATQWRHWCRIHWATLQCVFYVVLFGVFVFFLRVQEEEFNDHHQTDGNQR